MCLSCYVCKFTEKQNIIDGIKTCNIISFLITIDEEVTTQDSNLHYIFMCILLYKVCRQLPDFCNWMLSWSRSYCMYIINMYWHFNIMY